MSVAGVCLARRVKLDGTPFGRPPEAIPVVLSEPVQAQQGFGLSLPKEAGRGGSSMEQNTSTIGCPAETPAPCEPDTSPARRLVGEAIERLSADLAAGQSGQLRTYLAMLGRFHRYSLANVLLIAMQFPRATHVAGYRTWQGLGRQVRRGERGIRILAPIIRRIRKDAPEADEAVVAFRTVSVFDVSQTSGEPLPQFASVRGDPGVYICRLTEFIHARGIALRHSDVIGPADGCSSGGRITLRAGLEPATEFSVLAHELAHEMLHQDDEPIAAGRKARETEAEAVAFVVCQAIGLETGTASSDYIQLYQGGKDTLLASLGRIQQTAAEIIDGIMPAKGSCPVRASSRAQEEALHDR